MGSEAASWDVIVVGAGPGGAIAAKICAEEGFSTLVLEKRAWPRDKVCSGMIMGPWAHDIIRGHFGAIPPEVLVPPGVLKGHRFHVPGVPPETLDWVTPLAWRKDLDAWLIAKAEAAGAQVRCRTGVRRIAWDENPIRVQVAADDGEAVLSARWLIGADGANSVVRKSLSPEMKVDFSVPIRECYSGSLGLEKEYFHWFFPRTRPRPRFNVNHKGDSFLIEGSGVRELREDINRILAEYGFDPAQQPVWRDGCLIPKLHDALLSGAFSPARGNVLLVGDAAGLIFPITFEGIGSALKSGLLAADAVCLSAREGRAAAGFYLERLQSVLRLIEALHIIQDNLSKESATWPMDPAHPARSILKAYERTLRTT